MKKIISLLVILTILIIPAALNAQEPGITVDTDGNVGIGTDTPACELHLFDAAGAPIFSIEGFNGTSNFGSIDFIKVGTDFKYQLTALQNPNGYFLNFGFNDSTSWLWALSIKNGNMIGINNVNPQYALDVNGDINFTLNLIGNEGFSVLTNVTDVLDSADTSAPYSRVISDSFATNDIGDGQVFIEGSVIDANQKVEIAVGKAGGQMTQNVQIGDNNEIYVNTTTNNVGIGKSPDIDAKLDIDGDLKVNGTIDGFGVVPVGSIIAWHRDFSGSTPALPENWVICDGSQITLEGSPYYGMNAPDLNNPPNSYNSNGYFLRGGNTSGEYETDTFQGHKHDFLAGDNNVGNDNAGGPRGKDYNDSDYISEPTTDGVNGVPRTGSETKPVNMTVIWIMRIK